MVNTISNSFYGITVMIVSGIIWVYFLYKEIKGRNGKDRKKYIIKTGLIFIICYVLFWLFLIFIILEPS